MRRWTVSCSSWAARPPGSFQKGFQCSCLKVKHAGSKSGALEPELNAWVSRTKTAGRAQKVASLMGTGKQVPSWCLIRCPHQKPAPSVPCREVQLVSDGRVISASCVLSNSGPQPSMDLAGGVGAASTFSPPDAGSPGGPRVRGGAPVGAVSGGPRPGGRSSGAGQGAGEMVRQLLAPVATAIPLPWEPEEPGAPLRFSLGLSLYFTWPLLGGMPGKAPPLGRCARGPLPLPPPRPSPCGEPGAHGRWARSWASLPLPLTQAARVPRLGPGEHGPHWGAPILSLRPDADVGVLRLSRGS